MTKIGIIGTGRFALVLRSLLERSRDVVVMHSSTSKPVDHLHVFELQTVLECDIVVLATPIGALEAFVRENGARIRSTALVVDVSSVKIKPAAWMQQHIRADVDILATHPLFGPTSTKHGTQFSGLKCIVCPIRVRNIQKVVLWKSFFTTQGIQLHTMSPEEHDKLMARTQAVSFLFGHLGKSLKLHATEFDTAGFHSLLANQSIVAADSHQLLMDLFGFNPFAQEMLLACLEELQSLYFYSTTRKGGGI